MLTVKNLTKKFGGFTAVSSVDFSVEKGEILGLIGPNGSGKSTIFKVHWYEIRDALIKSMKHWSSPWRIGMKSMMHWSP